jgi:hypothetical protein
MRQSEERPPFLVREDAIAMAMLALLVVIAFANVVFGGRSLVPSESANPLDPRPQVRLRGPDFIPPSLWTQRDLVPLPNVRDITAATQQSDPYRQFLRRSLARGEFPFWDPYVGGGSPSMASLIPAYLFPPSLLMILLGGGSLLANLYALLLILVSGLLTYFLLRRHALDWRAALTGAIAFSFSGAVIQTAPWSLGQPIAFFSLPLLVTVRLIDRPSGRRAAQLALAFAFVALASFPPVLLQSFGMSAIYVAVALRQRRESWRRTAAWFLAGSAISLALVAPVYLPAIRLMQEATQIGEYYSHAAAAVMPMERMGQVLSPTIMGGAPIYAHPAVMRRTGYQLYYAGVAVLLLAAIGTLAASQARARALKITALLCGLLALAKVLGVPLIQWIAFVPFFRSIHYAAYFGIVVTYAIALLAALGVDALLARRARLAHAYAAAGLLAAALLLVAIKGWHSGVQQHPQGWRWIADFRLLVVFALVALVLTFLSMRRSRQSVSLVMALVLLVAFEGARNATYPRPRRWDVWSHPPQYVEILIGRNSGGRLLPMPIFPADTGSVFRQPTLDSILTASPRIHALYQRYFGPIPDVILRDTTRIPPEPVLDAANIEYLAVSSADAAHLAEGEQRGYATLFADDYVHLLRRQALARYTFTTQYRVAGSAANALDALATLPRGVALLEHPASFVASASPTIATSPRVTSFSLNAVELTLDVPRNGLLVCSESDMNGWRATIDGRSAEILPANYAFRALEIPAGRHTVKLQYEPPGLRAGLLLGLIGLVLCAWWWRRR